MYSALRNINNPLLQSILKPATIFMISTMIVNGGNYLYNLWLGRTLGPEAFSEAGLLLTFLLILSFAGMTFQLVASKFIIDLDTEFVQPFINGIKKMSLRSGIVIMILIVAFSRQITHYFHLQSQWSVIVFSLAVPAYFILSAERGLQQGSHSFIKLSYSYQIEIWSKFLLTAILLYVFQNQIGTAIALSLVSSVFISKYFQRSGFPVVKNATIEIPSKLLRKIGIFAGITLGYELIQIAINYGDMLMVKHYFDAQTAGLYTSIALIGRIIYFITWMMVMVLIPTILQKRKDGQPFKGTMFRYLGIIAFASASIVISSAYFPEFTIRLLFGDAFIAFAPLLWQYALATSLFALANLFIYYFISTEYYLPAFLAGISTVIQLSLYGLYHDTIGQIIAIQIGTMSVLLIAQLVIFLMRK